MRTVSKYSIQMTAFVNVKVDVLFSHEAVGS